MHFWTFYHLFHTLWLDFNSLENVSKIQSKGLLAFCNKSSRSKFLWKTKLFHFYQGDLLPLFFNKIVTVASESQREKKARCWKVHLFTKNLSSSDATIWVNKTQRKIQDWKLQLCLFLNPLLWQSLVVFKFYKENWILLSLKEVIFFLYPFN